MMMNHHMIGPYWGNVAVMTIGAIITIACFAAMFWMLFRPGEHGLDHIKRTILHDDR